MASRRHIDAKDTLSAVRRALQGRCFDCYGKGQRSNIVGTQVQCPTCGGRGRLSELTACQVALGADALVVEAYDALESLESQGIACRAGNAPELWRLTGAT